MERFWQYLQRGGASPAEIIIVDDRQLWRDYTTAELQSRAPQVPLRVLRPDRPAGQAAAMRSGAEAATSSALLFMDPDMVDALPFADALLAPLHQGAQAVHGVRTRGASSALLRRFGSGLSNLTVRYLAGLSVPDINSPVFVHRRENLALLAQLPSAISNPQLALYALLEDHVALVPVPSEQAADTPSSYDLSALLALYLRQLGDAWRVRRWRRQRRNSGA